MYYLVFIAGLITYCVSPLESGVQIGNLSWSGTFATKLTGFSISLFTLLLRLVWCPFLFFCSCKNNGKCIGAPKKWMNINSNNSGGPLLCTKSKSPFVPPESNRGEGVLWLCFLFTCVFLGVYVFKVHLDDLTGFDFQNLLTRDGRVAMEVGKDWKWASSVTMCRPS